MFGRLLFRLLRGNRGRLAVALVAVISGSAVISALLNIELDVGRKLAQEFRTLGPNLVVAPRGGIQTDDAGSASATLMDQEAVWRGIAQTHTPDSVFSAPYLYVVGRVNNTPVIVAGTQLQPDLLHPAWKLDSAQKAPPRIPGWDADTELLLDAHSAFVGQNAARRLHLALGGRFEVTYMNRTATLTNAAILDSGGAEDDQILAWLPTVQKLAALPGRIQFEELRKDGDAAEITRYAKRLSAALPAYEVRPIPQATQAEANLLKRTRLLVGSMVVLILALTALCVLATMAALAMERREDVGLMKALGGGIGRIVALFVAEVGVLGAAGGLIGCAIGVVLAQWMGRQVFGASVAPRWEIFPITVVLMTLVSMTGALPLRLLGRVKPALILRGE